MNCSVEHVFGASKLKFYEGRDCEFAFLHFHAVLS